ncbi:MAG: DUF5615 family PIN-like protein [Spirochaetes bacterium]|nr:DUF5615 family PIN-like protein [Spirochaetota bacterium]
MAGKPDIQIIDEAYKQERIILTHDSDFGTLAVAGHHRFTGIIYIRPGHIRGGLTIETMKTLLAQNIEFTVGMIIIVQRQDNDIRIRIRNLGE